MTYVRAEPIFGRFRVIPGGEFGADRSWIGPPAAPRHTGTDFACPVGTPVGAMLAGRVVRAGWDDSLSGYVVRVLADDGRSVLHAHLDRVTAQAGDHVEADQLVAYSGGTGSASTGPHLHSEYCVEHLGHRSATDCWRAGTLRDLMLELAGARGGDMDRETYAREIEPWVKETIREQLENDQITKDKVAGVIRQKLAEALER